LTPADVKAVSEALNHLLAEQLRALYLKTKNFHWHASGRHFRDEPVGGLDRPDREARTWFLFKAARSATDEGH
jgi:hypothetical protein